MRAREMHLNSQVDQSSGPVATASAPGGAVIGPAPGTAPSSVKRRHRRIGIRIAAPLALGLLLLCVWELVTGLHLVSSFFLPSPQTLVRALSFAITKESLFSYVMTTLKESAGGCVLAAAVGLPLGYAIAKSHLIASAVEPYLAAIQAVPAVAIAPLLALWIGYGLVPVVLLCALLVFFPIVINTALGITTIDREILEATQVEGVSRWATLRFIEMPLALPTLLAGFRTGFTLSITGSVVGEFVIGGTGLGQILITQRNYSDSAGEFSTLLVLAVLAILVYTLIRLLEAKAVERTR